MLKVELQAPLPDPETFEEIRTGSIAGLQDEIKLAEREMERAGVKDAVPVLSGELEGTDGDLFEYRLRVGRKVFPPEYSAVELIAEDPERNRVSRSRGYVQAVEDEGTTLLVALTEEAGMSVSKATLSFDTTHILKQMVERLEGLGPQLSGSHPNLDTVQRTLGLLPTLLAELPVQDPSIEKRKLNAEQTAAIAKTSGSNLGLIFGPPGTGKTKTLGSLVAELATAHNKRVLVTSHTNTALDTALASVLDALPAAWSRDGRVVREGRLTREFQHLDINRRAVAGRQQSAQALQWGQIVSRLEAQAQPFLKAGGSSLKKGKGRKKKKTSLNTPASRIAELVVQLSQAKAPWGKKGDLEAVLQEAKALAIQVADASNDILRDARIVGATLSQISLDTFNPGHFDAVIVDEASMAQLPQVMIAASWSRRQVILLGDPMQLPPVVQASTPAAERYLKRNLFQHLGLTSPTIEDPRRPMLREQYRMAPPIRALVDGLFYGNQLRDGPNVAAYEAGDRRNLVLADTSRYRGQSEKAGSSRANPGNAELLARIVRQLHDQMETDVGIITPFAAQSKLIRQAVYQTTPAFFRMGGTVSTIHRAQGGERDVILVDLVDTPPLRNMSSFLDSSWNRDLPQLMCVALSRARKRLILVAHAKGFRDKYGRGSSLLMEILARAYREGYYVALSEDAPREEIALITGGVLNPELAL